MQCPSSSTEHCEQDLFEKCFGEACPRIRKIHSSKRIIQTGSRTLELDVAPCSYERHHLAVGSSDTQSGEHNEQHFTFDVKNTRDREVGGILCDCLSSMRRGNDSLLGDLPVAITRSPATQLLTCPQHAKSVQVSLSIHTQSVRNSTSDTGREEVKCVLHVAVDLDGMTCYNSMSQKFLSEPKPIWSGQAVHVQKIRQIQVHHCER